MISGGFAQFMQLLMGNPVTNSSLITSPVPQSNTPSSIPILSSPPSSFLTITPTPTSTILPTLPAPIHSQQQFEAASVPIVPRDFSENASNNNSSISINDNNESNNDNDDDNDDNIDSTDHDNSKIVGQFTCKFCAKPFTSKKHLQRHLSQNYCSKKPVSANETLMKNFVPFKFTSKYYKIVWDNDFLCPKLIGIWSKYVTSETPNYFKNILESTIQFNITHFEPFESKTMLTYKSNLSKLLFWFHKSFPDSISEIEILKSLFHWDTLNVYLTEFQKMNLWLPKTFLNCCNALRRFMVMLIDVEFLKLHDDIYIELKSFVTKSKYINSLKTTILPSLEIKSKHTNKQVSITQPFSRTREKLEHSHKWVNFPHLIKGWNKGFLQIQTIIKNSTPNKNDHKILAQFLAFTIAVKLPPMRSQNLTFFGYSTESQVLEKISLLNDPTNKCVKQNYGVFNKKFTQFDLYYTKYKTFKNYGAIYRSFSGEIVTYFHFYVKLTKKLFNIDLMDGALFFESKYARPGRLIQQAIVQWVDSKSLAGMQSIRYSISTFNAKMEKQDKLSKGNVKLIEEGCLHSTHVATKFYDKPSLKQKGILIVETYNKILSLASIDNDENNDEKSDYAGNDDIYYSDDDNDNDDSDIDSDTDSDTDDDDDDDDDDDNDDNDDIPLKKKKKFKH